MPHVKVEEVQILQNVSTQPASLDQGFIRELGTSNMMD